MAGRRQFQSPTVTADMNALAVTRTAKQLETMQAELAKKKSMVDRKEKECGDFMAGGKCHFCFFESIIRHVDASSLGVYCRTVA
jgi:hypothetical protein